jgi:hypothetical protein
MGGCSETQGGASVEQLLHNAALQCSLHPPEARPLGSGCFAQATHRRACAPQSVCRPSGTNRGGGWRAVEWLLLEQLIVRHLEPELLRQRFLLGTPLHGLQMSSGLRLLANSVSRL